MDRCTGDATEILLETTLNTMQSFGLLAQSPQSLDRQSNDYAYYSPLPHIAAFWRTKDI